MDAILQQDLSHFRHHFFQKMPVSSILAFSHHPYLSILSQIHTDPLPKESCIYVDASLIDQCSPLDPQLILTNACISRKGWVCIPFSLGLYACFKGTIDISFLPRSANLYNFNATVVCLENGRYTTIRNTGEPVYAVRSSQTKFTKSDIELYLPNGRKIIQSPTICREDMRLFVFQNQLYGSYTRIDPYISGVKTQNTLSIGRFDESYDIVEEYVLPYGGNLNNGPEKNWTFWESPYGLLHCVYSFTPFCMLEFPSFSESPTNITMDCTLPDLIRGGAPGVVYDEKVWCFTHVHVEGGLNVGIVVLSHTNIPIVLGYCNTLIESKHCMNLFFYVCGAYMDMPTLSWKVTGGAQDTQSCVLTFPHADLLGKIHWF